MIDDLLDFHRGNADIESSVHHHSVFTQGMPRHQSGENDHQTGFHLQLTMGQRLTKGKISIKLQKLRISLIKT